MTAPTASDLMAAKATTERLASLVEPTKLERRLAVTGAVPPKRITDRYLSKLLDRVCVRFRRAAEAGPDEGAHADRMLTVARRRLDNALLQRERETAAHLGRCSGCGVRALRGVFDWPDMRGPYGHCVGCGSTIAVIETRENETRPTAGHGTGPGSL